MLKNKSCPQVVPSLEGLFIEDIAVGCEHVLTLSSTGDVYAWGCNSEGQVTKCSNIKLCTLKFVFTAHQKHCIDCTVVLYVCVPAWSWTLEPRRSSKPIFVQIAKQVVSLNPLELRLPSRAWKVKLVGEGADDAGGVFDDTITEMCQELQSGVVDLLIHTPNSFADVGSNTDRFLLNPAALSEDHMVQFRFLGILMAVAIRTKKPLDLHLAPWVWKQLCSMPLGGPDLEEMIPLDSFVAHSADGRLVPVVSGGQNISLTFANRTEYVERALEYRLHEMDSQVAAIREGMSTIIPVPLLSLLTAQQLEQLVCGLPEVSVEMLKKLVRYRDITESHQLIGWFWQSLEEFTNEERVLFLRFVSGRSRLPSNPADITQKFQIIKVDRPVNGLPTAQTCFFLLRLPPYTSQAILAERLRYSIHNCPSIDMDNYMLTHNTDPADSSDTED
uniref:HECT-type E3 ubiquitin transferase n=1 Tax=Seriola lalandi dorsalis TaxID=1841481 RepID=A0A3B4WSJ7_SERLL